MAATAACVHVWLSRFAVVYVSAVLLASGVPARADTEHLSLPYSCSVERGRMVLTPTAERQTYRVLGTRASHAFTACSPGKPERCRTWQIHKFDFSCAGQRVPWLAVATHIVDRAPKRGRVENGRLMLQLGPAWQRREPVPTGFRHPFDQRSFGGKERLLSFPIGYAPALGTGVRFTGSSAPPPTVIDAKTEPKVAKADTSEPRSAGRPSPQPIPGLELPPEPSRSSPPAGDIVALSGWTATVTTESAPAAVSTLTYLMRGVFGVALVSFAWVGLMLARRRGAPAASGHPTPGTQPDSGAAASVDIPVAASDQAEKERQEDAVLCAELVSRAVNLHQAARDAVVTLPNDNLRDILSTDLAALQQRLLAPDLTAAIADERWHVVKPRVTQALADLERIARTIAGVLSSRPSSHPSGHPSNHAEQPRDALPSVVSIPETAQQAFEVLGINPDASRAVIKKVVDGLRQSWHPDHARDEADRARREERMKQINVAWQLIRATHDNDADDARTERAA